jgi:malonyl-CoA/methylmalonyl-CoA synthetase
VSAEGAYKIVGRTSVDVIKSGGYKISALDVERHLLAHPNISDCAVVGLPDITWGQRVAAVIVLKDTNTTLTLEELKRWAADVLPPYQIPSILRCLPSMPRNAMGKVNKKQLAETVFPEFLKRQ